MADPVTEAADRLYTVPPRRFVAERDAAVAAARAAGDPTTAAALAKLRRPSLAAWLVNLLALRRPELVAELAELATALQAAQRDLDGAQLRELTGQRRAAVSALVAAAGSLAREVEPSLGDAKLPLAEVETTLSAALADAEVAAAVRSGRLTKAAVAEGFGELPRARLRLVSGEGRGIPEAGAAEAGAAPGGEGAPGAAAPGAAIRQAVAAELTDAQAAAAAASAELDRAATVQSEAKQALAEIDSELAALTERRTVAATRLAEAESASLAARRAVVAARRRVGEAEAAAAELDAGTSA